MEGGHLPQAGVQPVLEKVWLQALGAREVLRVAKGRAAPQSTGKLETTFLGMESLLSCYCAETKMAAWNGCLAASSRGYAPFLSFANIKLLTGFFLAQAVSPVPMPEELTWGLFGVCMKPSFTNPVISKLLDRDPTWCRLMLALPRCAFPAHAPFVVAELCNLP